MLIVDSQIHLYEGNGAKHHGGRPHPIERALTGMADAGVDAAINHPPYWDVNSHQYAVEAARREPSRFATLAWIDLSDPGAPDMVEHWQDTPGWIGLRYICVAPEEETWPFDGTMDWLWPKAQDLGIPIAIGGPNMLGLTEDLAQRYPGLKITIDHLGFVGFTDDHRIIQHPDILQWARYGNVAVKLTGLPDYAGGDPYPYTRLHDLVRMLYDAYGPERLFWGSDITRLPCSWEDCISVFTEEMPFLTESDKRLVMGEAFCAWHDWWPERSSANSSDENILGKG